VRELPIVSIVTPSYNMGRYIEHAISSVLSQDYPRIEYIVVDAGSTDGTLEILQRYRHGLHFTSGRDSGPADAINRGFLDTTGSLFAWLNADDTFLPGAVGAAVEHFERHPDIDIAYGNAHWTGPRGEIVGSYPARDFDRALLAQECFICQPASFLRAPIFRRLTVNPRLQYAFDYDLWIRAAAQGCRFGRIDRNLACSRMHLENRTLGRRGGVLRECMQVLQTHFGYVPFSWVHTYCCYLLDCEDQFYRPIRPSFAKYAMSLPVGLWKNRAALRRYLAEWWNVMNPEACRRQWRR
jgi:glycosyltransferase involved in cell wall biosynthesis